MYNWIDKEYINNFGSIVGVDEAGRGPLAGPVIAAAVFLTESQEKELLTICPFITDSKKLSEKKRNMIWLFVKKNNIIHGIGLCDPTTIDFYNILVSTNMAMNKALEKINIPFDLALVDGKNLSIDYPNKQIIQGDSHSLRIALASNIAKVVRDKIMIGYSKIYPQFDFEKNKGYGTKNHKKAIDRFGPTPFHRLTFRPIVEQINENSLFEWLESGLIENERYDCIFKKFGKLYSRQEHLTGFMSNMRRDSLNESV